MTDIKVENAELTELGEGQPGDRVVSRQSLDVVRDVELKLTAVLGTTLTTVGEMFALKEDSVLTLDTLADQPIELLLDGQVVARGRLVIADDHFGVQITEAPDVE